MGASRKGLISTATRKNPSKRTGGKAPPAGDRVSRSELCRRLGVSLGAVRGWEQRGLLVPIRYGNWIYFDPEDVAKFELARLAGRPEGGGHVPPPRPPSELADLEPSHVRRGLAALASGMSPIELAIRHGLAARHVRALVEEWKILRDIKAQPKCHRCDEQPATLCQECAAAPFGSGAAPWAAPEDAAAASGPTP